MGLREQIKGLEEVGRVCVTVEMVRDTLRDHERFNEIVRQDLTDDEYADIIIKCLADFNAMRPFFSNFGPLDFPDRSLLLDWATAESLKRLYMWHARNQFSASDAGLQIPIHEQWQPLLQIERMLREEVRLRSKELKTSMNISGGWGGNFSPLWWL